MTIYAITIINFIFFVISIITVTFQQNLPNSAYSAINGGHLFFLWLSNFQEII